MLLLLLRAPRANVARAPFYAALYDGGGASKGKHAQRRRYTGPASLAAPPLRRPPARGARRTPRVVHVLSRWVITTTATSDVWLRLAP